MKISFAGVAVGLALRWLGDIVPALINGAVPKELDHYTSIIVYSMDLGLVVPTFFVSAILILKRSPFGYLLTSIMIIKSVMMWTAHTAMTIGAGLEGVQLSIADMAMAPVFGLISCYCLVLILKNVNFKDIR